MKYAYKTFLTSILILLFTTGINCQNKPSKPSKNITDDSPVSFDTKEDVKKKVSVIEIFQEENKSGLRFLDDKKIILAPIYDRIDRITKGSAVFSPNVNGENHVFIVKKDGKRGVVNPAGEFLLELIYDEISSNFVVKNGEYWIIDLNNEAKHDYSYDFIQYLNETTQRFQQNGKWGIISHSGKILVPADFIELEHESLYQYAKLTNSEGKSGIYNLLSKEMTIKPVYDRVDKVNMNRGKGFVTSRTDLNAYFLVDKNSKKGVIDKKGSVYLLCEYDGIKVIAEYHNVLGFIVERDDRKGWYSSSGASIHEIEYSELVHLNQGRLALKKDAHFALATTDGVILTAFEFDKIGYFFVQNVPPQYLSARVEKNGKYGLLYVDGMIMKNIDKKIQLKGYQNIEDIGNAFAEALKSDDNELLRQFCTDLSIDTSTVNLMLRLDLVFRDKPRIFVDGSQTIDSLSNFYFKFFKSYRDKLRRDVDIKTIEFVSPIEFTYELFSEKYDIETIRTVYTLKSNVGVHSFRFGQLINVNGTWRTFERPNYY